MCIFSTEGTVENLSRAHQTKTCGRICVKASRSKFDSRHTETELQDRTHTENTFIYNKLYSFLTLLERRDALI